MTIAAHIDAPSLYDNGLLTECMLRLADVHPQQHFIFFSQKELSLTVPANVTIVMIQPVIKNTLLLRYWYHFKLPGLLKRYAVDVFISSFALSKKNKVAQVLLLQNELFAGVNPNRGFERKYLKSNLTAFLAKASMIVADEPAVVPQISKAFPSLKTAPTVLLFGLPSSFRPYSWKEKEMVCETYAAGNEYFFFQLTPSSASYAITVLKAFSIFKKWQKSSIQLLILSIDDSLAIPELSTYKLKDEVRYLQLQNPDSIASIVSSAYALIEPGDDLIALYALQAGIPAIVADDLSNRSRYMDAVFYFENSPQKLSAKMMELYKEEILKNEHIQKGLKLTAQYNWNHSASVLWETILRVTEAAKP